MPMTSVSASRVSSRQESQELPRACPRTPGGAPARPPGARAAPAGGGVRGRRGRLTSSLGSKGWGSSTTRPSRDSWQSISSALDAPAAERSRAPCWPRVSRPTSRPRWSTPLPTTSKSAPTISLGPGPVVCRGSSFQRRSDVSHLCWSGGATRLMSRVSRREVHSRSTNRIRPFAPCLGREAAVASSAREEHFRHHVQTNPSCERAMSPYPSSDR